MTRLGFSNWKVRGRMGISFCEMSSRNGIEFTKRISSDARSGYFVYLSLQTPFCNHVAERCIDHLNTMQYLSSKINYTNRREVKIMVQIAMYIVESL